MGPSLGSDDAVRSMLALACAGTPPHQTALTKDFSVPLHIKPVGTVDISTASKIIHDSYRQQWEYAWTQLADVEVLEKAAVKITRRPKSAKLSTQDIQRCSNATLFDGVIRPTVVCSP